MNLLIEIKADQGQQALLEHIDRVGKDIEVAVESILVVELDRLDYRSVDIEVKTYLVTSEFGEVVGLIKHDPKTTLPPLNSTLLFKYAGVEGEPVVAIGDYGENVAMCMLNDYGYPLCFYDHKSSDIRDAIVYPEDVEWWAELPV